MPQFREVRADFNRETIVVYQAYNDAIADAAVRCGRFVEPFSVGRMTWIKPSFLWLMERSGWASKPNQSRILAVRISRKGWDRALSLGALTAFDPSIHASYDKWGTHFASEPVHAQWDPERSIYGKKLDYRSIQIGLGRAVIAEYVREWTVEIRDLTGLVAKLRRLRQQGHYSKAKELLPRERVYPVDRPIGRRLGIDY